MRERKIFEGAIARSEGSERNRYLEEQCGSDLKLLRRVERLLENHRTTGSFLDPVRHPLEPTELFSDESTEVALPPQIHSHAKVRYVGDYELIDEIARGGMGVVFRARQMSLNRIVAIKLLIASTSLSNDAKARFVAEAESAAMLDHPNILPVYEIGEHGAVPYYSMKLVEGGSLANQLPYFQRNRPSAVELIAKVSRAVHYGHARGIIHRDLKPGNILLEKLDQPLVADFGLAKRLEADGGLTRSGDILGTPSYMSPEQAKGHKSITTGVDIFALGCMLYELLAGQKPFPGNDALDVLRRVVEEEPQPLGKVDPSIDLDLETIAFKCLEKDCDKRYPTAAALADDLERWLRGEPVHARRIGRVERLWKWARRHPSRAGLTLSATALSFLLLVGVPTFWYRDQWLKQRANQAEQRENQAKTSETEAKTESSQTLERLGHEKIEAMQAQVIAYLNSATAIRAKETPGTIKSYWTTLKNAVELKEPMLAQARDLDANTLSNANKFWMQTLPKLRYEALQWSFNSQPRLLKSFTLDTHDKSQGTIQNFGQGGLPGQVTYNNNPRSALSGDGSLIAQHVPASDKEENDRIELWDCGKREVVRSIRLPSLRTQPGKQLERVAVTPILNQKDYLHLVWIDHLQEFAQGPTSSSILTHARYSLSEEVPTQVSTVDLGKVLVAPVVNMFPGPKSPALSFRNPQFVLNKDATRLVAFEDQLRTSGLYEGNPVVVIDLNTHQVIKSYRGCSPRIEPAKERTVRAMRPVATLPDLNGVLFAPLTAKHPLVIDHFADGVEPIRLTINNGLDSSEPVVISPNGKWLATIQVEGYTTRAVLQNLSEPQSTYVELPNDDSVNRSHQLINLEKNVEVCFSPDSERLLVATPNQLSVIQVAENKLLWSWNAEVNPKSASAANFDPRKTLQAETLQFLPDNRIAVCYAVPNQFPTLHQQVWQFWELPEFSQQLQLGGTSSMGRYVETQEGECMVAPLSPTETLSVTNANRILSRQDFGQRLEGRQQFEARAFGATGSYTRSTLPGVQNFRVDWNVVSRRKDWRDLHWLRSRVSAEALRAEFFDPIEFVTSVRSNQGQIESFESNDNWRIGLNQYIAENGLLSSDPTIQGDERLLDVYENLSLLTARRHENQSSLIVRDHSTGQIVFELSQPILESVISARFHEKGKYIIADCSEGSLLARVDGGSPPTILPEVRGSSSHERFDLLVRQNHQSGMWSVYNPEDGKPQFEIASANGLLATATCLDGSLVAFLVRDEERKSTIILWSPKVGSSKRIDAEVDLFDGFNILAMSDNGDRLVLLNRMQGSMRVRMWDTNTQKLLVQEGNSGKSWINCAILPDANCLVVDKRRIPDPRAASDETTIYDLQSGKRRSSLTEHTLEVKTSFAGKYLIVRQPNRELTIYDALKSEKVVELGSGELIGFGRQHVIIASDDQVKLWNVLKKKSFTIPVNAKSHLRLGESETVLVSSEVATGLTQAWDTQNGKLICTLELRGESSLQNSLPPIATALNVSPTGKRVAVAVHNETRIFDLESGKQTAVVPRTSHPDGIRCLASGPDNLLVTGGLDPTISLWEASTGKHLAMLEGFAGELSAVAFVGISQLLARDKDGTLVLCHIDEQNSKYQLEVVWQKMGPKPSRRTSAIALTNGNSFATGNEDGSIDIRSLVDGEATLHFDPPAESNKLNSLTFNPSGTHLILGSDDGPMRSLEIASGVAKMLGSKSGSVIDIEFIDVDVFCRLARDGTLDLWHTDGQWIAELPTPKMVSTDMALNLDRSSLFTTGSDGTVMRVNMANVQQMLASHGLGWSNRD